MDLRKSVAIRALAEEDVDGIVSLCGACSRVEADLGPITAAQWRAFVGRPRFARGRDFRVAVEGGRIVGMVESSLRDQSGRDMRYIKIVVDPSRRRARVGTDLLAAVLEQDRNDDVSIQGHVRRGWAAGEGFCRQMGFAVIESEYRMHCDALRPVPSHAEPALIGPLHDVAPHAARLAEIHNGAFRDDVSFTPHSPEDMIHKAEDHRTWAAVVDGEIVAHAIVEHGPASDWLESLAVDPTFQGRGIGTALAVRGLGGGRSGDGRAAGLSVSSRNPSALHIYGKLGFRTESEKLRFAAGRGDLLSALRRRKGVP